MSLLRSKKRKGNTQSNPAAADNCQPQLENTLEEGVEKLTDMPITEHLIELRARLINIMIALAVVLLPMAFYFNDIYYLFSQPLVTVLPTNSTIVATDLVSGFMAQVRLCVFLAIFLIIPYILHQVWSFVAPGLYGHEKKIALPVLLASVVLFYSGVAFAYFIILQRALVFLVSILPINVVSMPDIESYLNFATKILLVFGAAFEIPVVVFMLIAAGVTSAAALADKRRYVIVACFAAAGVLSPPDVPTMFMLAIPMMLLFELGLLAARVLVKAK